MAHERIILEMGMGNDLYGEDYTKAVCRAVQDALHHSTLTLFRSLKIDPKGMIVNLTVGVDKPEEVDKVRVAAEFPHGQINVTVVPGGQVIEDSDNGTRSIVATVAVEATLDGLKDAWRLAE